MLKEMVYFMLVSSGAPQNLWGEALLTANYILNRVPHKKLGFIPLSYGMEGHLLTITSKYEGALQKY